MITPRREVLVTGLLLLVGVLSSLPEAAAVLRPASDTHAEVVRLRAHFDSVDAELRAPTTEALSAPQRAARLQLIGWLREYRDAGVFPQNDRFPGRAVPFFRDSRGVLCAMAYLIERTGRKDLVDRVADAQNNARIRELSGNQDLRAWLDSVGMSVEEAARVQPTYGGPGLGVSDRGLSATYAVTSVLVSGTGVATIWLNTFRPSKVRAWAGIAAGTAGIIAASANRGGTAGTHTLTVANALIGGGAVAVGAYRLFRPRPQPVRAKLSGDAPRWREGASLVPTLLRRGDDAELGFLVRARF